MLILKNQVLSFVHKEEKTIEIEFNKMWEKEIKLSKYFLTSLNGLSEYQKFI